MLQTMQNQPPVYDQIRQAIETGDKIRYRLSKETGISEGHLCQFMGKTKGLSVESLDLLASHLGWEIIARPKRGKRTKAKASTTTSATTTKPQAHNNRTPRKGQ